MIDENNYLLSIHRIQVDARAKSDFKIYIYISLPHYKPYSIYASAAL